MGSPKALLPLRGHSFLARLVDALRRGGCASVVVVTGGEADENAAAITREARSLGSEVAINPDPDSDQITSLRAAIRILPPDVEGIAVTPVDAPCVEPGIVADLIREIGAGGLIALPVFEGRRGHPVVFARALFEELLSDPLPEGARTVIRGHPDRLVEVAVGSPDILLDVDTPEDYRRLQERLE